MRLAANDGSSDETVSAKVEYYQIWELKDNTINNKHWDVAYKRWNELGRKKYAHTDTIILEHKSTEKNSPTV